MPIRIEQNGIFHVTTNTKKKMPWCTLPGIPEILIDNLLKSKNLYGVQIYGFTILPDHLHLLFETGPKGLSAFMHSFKVQAGKDVKNILAGSAGPRTRTTGNGIYFPGWQRGFYDETVHTEKQMRAVQTYINCNASNHGLVENYEDWPWMGMHFPDVLD